MNINNIDYKNETILLVDDEAEIRETLKDLLEQLGFNVDQAESAKEAISIIKAGKIYTFLITDIVLQEMDGLELSRWVTNNCTDICIIAMTGFSNQYDYSEVVNAGATDFISKPYIIDELEAKIRRCIIERNMRQGLKQLSITDELTGLYNQRHFFSSLSNELKRAQRQKQSLGLLFCDLDNMKTINDQQGHVAGDMLLQNFGKVINSQIRQGVDSGFRYGGDEFAIILINATEEICVKIGNRITALFKEKHGADVSVGHALFSQGMTAEDLFKAADESLYEAKDKKQTF